MQCVNIPLVMKSLSFEGLSVLTAPPPPISQPWKGWFCSHSENQPHRVATTKYEMWHNLQTMQIHTWMHSQYVDVKHQRMNKFENRFTVVSWCNEDNEPWKLPCYIRLNIKKYKEMGPVKLLYYERVLLYRRSLFITRFHCTSNTCMSSVDLLPQFFDS